MKKIALMISLLLLGAGSYAQTKNVNLSPADTDAVFKAAKFKKKGKSWVSCDKGKISEVRDINGDGLPEAIVVEGSFSCFGNIGVANYIVSKQPDGKWKLVASVSGFPKFLNGPTVNGWPDLEIGGPGFCFPVLRWNGQKYEHNRNEYEGKPC